MRSFLVVTASVVVLSGCAANQQAANQQAANQQAANQQAASTAIFPQEAEDRSVCLQRANRDSGLNEKAFTSCMTKKGYKKDKLHPSVTTADAGNPPLADAGPPPLSDTLNDTWRAVSPDNAAHQPDSENAGQSRTEDTTQPPSPAVY